jgi:aminodeoxyfutalosine synthase
MDAGRKRELEATVYSGKRLGRADGIDLYECNDLVWLGRLAHHVRTRRNGDRVLFGVSRRLDLGGWDGEQDPERVEEAVVRATAMANEQVTELHIVNAVDPRLSWEHYPRMLSALRDALPGTSLMCFSAADFHSLEQASGQSAEAILDALIDAGLTSLYGGGAVLSSGGVELRRAGAGFLDGDIQQPTVDRAERREEWVRIHRLAHAKGLKTPAFMVYGHDERPDDRVDHVLRLRELQDETNGFAVFTPLRYQPDTEAVPASPAESLKLFAVSRLLLDNVPHLESSWTVHGLSVAQLSLNFGADALAGPIAADETGRDGDFEGAPDTLDRDDLRQLIWDAGLRPVERDGRYAVLREYDAAPTLADRRAEPQRVWA